MPKHNDKRRLLIVDDDKNICIILSNLARREGFEVVTASDGEKALQMIHLEEPDLLVSDIKMPGMDGMELLRKAKELDQDLPVILITGHADVEGAVRAIRAGAHDYISKPFDN